MVANFNYTNLQRRTLSGSSLQSFIWLHHNYGTAYKEPFERVSNRNSQGYIPDVSVKPVRIFTLNFPILCFDEDSESWLKFSPEFDFSALLDFYKVHQTHTNFIYPHPVYGDIVVRFFKPLALPKKNKDGNGTVQGFSVELIEVITTDYTFHKGENFSGDLPLFLQYYDVEIEYPDNTTIFPLGGNYAMVFEDAQKPLRRFKLTCLGLQYFINQDEEIQLDIEPERNIALLEIFYLKNRLDKVFTFSYRGENIPVRFDTPLNIPMVTGNTGVVGQLELTFIETPYPTGGFTIHTEVEA